MTKNHQKTDLDALVRTIADTAARASVEATVSALPELIAAMQGDGKATAKPTKKAARKVTKKRRSTGARVKAADAGLTLNGPKPTTIRKATVRKTTKKRPVKTPNSVKNLTAADARAQVMARVQREGKRALTPGSALNRAIYALEQMKATKWLANVQKVTKKWDGTDGWADAELTEKCLAQIAGALKGAR